MWNNTVGLSQRFVSYVQCHFLMGEGFATSLDNLDGNVTSIKFWRVLEKM